METPVTRCARYRLPPPPYRLRRGLSTMGNYLGKNDRDPCADGGDDDGGNDVGPPLGSGEASVGCLEEWRRQRCRLLRHALAL